MRRPRAARRAFPILGGVLLALMPAAVSARKKPTLPEPPPLTQTYSHRGGAFRFQVPEGWSIGDKVNGDPDAVQAAGDGLVVRFIYRPREAGYDALHGSCLSERLTARWDASGPAQFEYDYVEGSYGDRRSLDSAFVVDYESEIFGHRKWRQRNLTVVGGGHSLCLIAFAPASVWKKSSEARALLEAVLQNVKFQE